MSAPDGPAEAPASRGGTVLMPAPGRSSEPGRASRASGSGVRPRSSRTTIFEVSAVAARLSSVHPKAEPSLGRQLKLSFFISLTLMLLLTMVFVGGAWRVVLGLLAGTGATTLALWGTLRSLPRIAKWLGPRELPGRPWMWLSGALVLVSAATVLLIMSLSVATASLAVVGVPEVTPPDEPAAEEEPVQSDKPVRADKFVERGTHVRLGDGVLYAPPDFASADGRFDLVVHYHGNVELVELSIAAAKLNALALVINYGESSGRYSRPLSNPDAFDNLLNSVEARAATALRLANPRVERVALSSWSAGYGAVYHIIRSRSRLDRVDALLLMDSLHGHFAPGQETKLLGLRLKPFVTFAKRALADEKLMVLTHSAVETHGYPSTTVSADDLLRRLGVPRSKANPASASPPPVEIDVAVKAFPSGERNWMQVGSEVHRGAFHVLGCGGKGKGDHIAHLAQMSVTVLPLLATRWAEQR
ncbi:MAG: hypothetical protein JRI68_28805 [Deltaproteobacteria bacterium]|nr:hypothetical protein [Deltaproteobacteria bacterium]